MSYKVHKNKHNKDGDCRFISDLDGSGKQMSVMRQTRCKRRSIVESEFWTSFGELQTSLKCIDISPKCDNFLFFFCKVERRGYYNSDV